MLGGRSYPYRFAHCTYWKSDLTTRKSVSEKAQKLWYHKSTVQMHQFSRGPSSSSSSSAVLLQTATETINSGAFCRRIWDEALKRVQCRSPPVGEKLHCKTRHQNQTKNITFHSCRETPLQAGPDGLNSFLPLPPVVLAVFNAWGPRDPGRGWGTGPVMSAGRRDKEHRKAVGAWVQEAKTEVAEETGTQRCHAHHPKVRCARSPPFTNKLQRFVLHDMFEFRFQQFSSCCAQVRGRGGDSLGLFRGPPPWRWDGADSDPPPFQASPRFLPVHWQKHLTGLQKGHARTGKLLQVPKCEVQKIVYTQPWPTIWPTSFNLISYKKIHSFSAGRFIMVPRFG